LLATSPAPAQGIGRFFEGTLYGIVTAAACKFLVLPHISGFALLSIVLIAFWTVGIHATTRPRHALQGIAYLIAFNTLVGTGGTAQYDFTDFANQALAWLVALAICLLAFQLLPGQSARHVHVLTQALHRDTRRLLRHGRRMDLLKWQARQQHRLVALQALLGAGHQPAGGAGSVSLQLSRRLLTLQRQTRELEPDSAIAKCAQRGERRISRYASTPAISAAQARRTSRSLTRLGAHALAAGYQDLAGLLDTYSSITNADIRIHSSSNNQGEMK
jgi:uncharacterized membrane protein YccC